MDMLQRCCAFVILYHVVWASPDEKRLQEQLLSDYNKQVRPVAKRSQNIDVKFGMSMIAIEDLDEKSQTLMLHGWLHMMWDDVYLVWDPDEFDGIRTIRLPIDTIWRPDILLYNSQSVDMWETTKFAQVVIYSSGTVIWVPPVRMRVGCLLDMTRFPWDKHECTLKFGSWTYDSTKVNISFNDMEEVALEHYSSHHEWRITNYHSKRSEKVYDCCPNHTYPDMTYYVTLNRVGTYYTHLFAAPSVAMMFLMPAMFLLPPDSGEKTTLGVGILISQTMLMTSIENILPSAHPTVPLIAAYFLTNIVLTSMSLFFSALIVNAWAKSNRNAMVPQFLRTMFFGLLGRLLCVHRENFMPTEANSPLPLRRLDVLGEGIDNPSPNFVEDDKQQMMQTYARLTTISEWRQLAVIVDRLFFVIFVVVAIMIFFILGTS